MTGQLKTTLQSRADMLARLDLDLDVIVRDGNRRLRRRRTALAAGGAALALVAAGTASGLHGRGTTAEPATADQNVKPLTYAVGSVIHTGDGTIDVGRRVVSMIQTARGFVFSDPDQNVYEETDGDVQPIGHLATAQSKLVTGDDGQVTTWFDGSIIQAWPLTYGVGVRHTLDVADSWSKNDPPQVEAITDGQAWFWDGQKTRVSEVAPSPGSAQWTDPDLQLSDTVQDGGGGKLLVRVAGGMAVTDANLMPHTVESIAGWNPGTDLSGTAQVADVSSGDLSPDGSHWFTQDADQFAVFDSTTGERQDVAYKDLGFDFAAPYQWLDDDTIAVLALPRATTGLQPISLLTCHVSTNDCVVTARDIGDATDVALPIGESLQHQ
jgi:hypothetical protein